MIASVADVRDFHAVKAALDAGVDQFGRLDIVCANAGIATMAFRELTIDEELEQWTDVLNVNLVGAFHTAKAAIPHLVAGQRGGRSCSPARLPDCGDSADCKAAAGIRGLQTRLVGLMRTLSNALAPQSIRVNTVHPTAVRTMMAVNPAMTAFLENYPDGGPHLQNPPMPVDLLEPEDISAAIAYLVSDEAKYVTGVTLPVDAGFTNKL